MVVAETTEVWMVIGFCHGFDDVLEASVMENLVWTYFIAKE